MNAPLASYSDEERERLRAALREYAAHYKLSPQQLADRISDATNYALEFDAGRRRVDRFLKNSHRQPDDFIAAIAAFLGTVPPPDIEQMAASLAHFFAREVPRPIDISGLAGRYLAWVSTVQRPESELAYPQVMKFDGFGFEPLPPTPMTDKAAYAVIEMRRMAKSDALMVSEAFVNGAVNPGMTDFPNEAPRTHDAGVIVAFGFSDREVQRYLMTTRTVLETRLYRLYRAADDPLTLRGELNFNGGIGRVQNWTHNDPLHSDYAIELVKVSGDVPSGHKSG